MRLLLITLLLFGLVGCGSRAAKEHVVEEVVEVSGKSYQPTGLEGPLCQHERDNFEFFKVEGTESLHDRECRQKDFEKS